MKLNKLATWALILFPITGTFCSLMTITLGISIMTRVHWETGVLGFIENYAVGVITFLIGMVTLGTVLTMWKASKRIRKEEEKESEKMAKN